MDGSQRGARGTGGVTPFLPQLAGEGDRSRSEWWRDRPAEGGVLPRCSPSSVSIDSADTRRPRPQMRRSSGALRTRAIRNSSTSAPTCFTPDTRRHGLCREIGRVRISIVFQALKATIWQIVINPAALSYTTRIPLYSNKGGNRRRQSGTSRHFAPAKFVKRSDCNHARSFYLGVSAPILEGV